MPSTLPGVVVELKLVDVVVAMPETVDVEVVALSAFAAGIVKTKTAKTARIIFIFIII